MKSCFTAFGLCLTLSACSQSILEPYTVAKPNTAPSVATAPSSGATDATDSDPVDPNASNPSQGPSPNSTASSPTPNTPAPGNAVPATGSVTVTLNIIPPTPAGPYRNRGHIRSVWITDANDKYIRTIHAFAGQRAFNLKRWQALTGNVVDGTTGATQTTPAAGIPITATWDLKDKAGGGVMTGNYKLWFEFCEANTPALDAGKKPADLMQAIDGTAGYEFQVLPFSLSPTGSSKNDSSNVVFKDIAVKHVP